MSPWRVVGYQCRLYPADVKTVTDEECHECYRTYGLNPAQYRSCSQRYPVTEKEAGLL